MAGSAEMVRAMEAKAERALRFLSRSRSVEQLCSGKQEPGAHGWFVAALDSCVRRSTGLMMETIWMRAMDARPTGPSRCHPGTSLGPEQPLLRRIVPA